MITVKGNSAIYEGPTIDEMYTTGIDVNTLFHELNTNKWYYLTADTTWGEVPNTGGGGSGFTPTDEQLAAMNSGATTAKIEQIETNKNNILLKAYTSDVNTATANLQAQIDQIAQAAGTGSADTEVAQARVGADGTTYNNLKARLDADSNKIDSGLIEFKSSNLLDASKAMVGYKIESVIGNNESFSEAADRVTTPAIPCKKGDAFNVTRIATNGNFAGVNSINFVIAIACDESGTVLQLSTWVNGFTVTENNAKYVRFTISKAVWDVAKIMNITKNYAPTTGQSVEVYYKALYVPKNKAVENVYDMWGDSRISNGFNVGTDIATYLNTLLNDNVAAATEIVNDNPYKVVTNHGVIAQASGMVAARFGSNEVHVTLANNKINATGDSNVTSIRVSTGDLTNFRTYQSDPTLNVECEIAGVKGYLYYSQSTYKFARAEEGEEIAVRPYEKVTVSTYNSKDHVCIIQCGKNDMGLANGYQVGGTIGNVVGMIRSMRHDRFIILGETYNNDSSYNPGTTNRGYVDDLNTWYGANYPDNFINIQSELVANGLTLEGITPTAQDEEDIASGFIPSSLMYDEVHPNENGREATAKIIYSWLSAKGWI